MANSRRDLGQIVCSNPIETVTLVWFDLTAKSVVAERLLRRCRAQ